MRRIIAASILLSPLFLTATAIASTPASEADALTPARAVSTGVIPAHVLYAAAVEIPNSATIPNEAEVVLQLNVGQDGQARDIEVVKSDSVKLNPAVVDAVRKFRFRPATLDNQAIDIPMELTVVVQR
jgi:TonB family protein